MPAILGTSCDGIGGYQSIFTPSLFFSKSSRTVAHEYRTSSLSQPNTLSIPSPFNHLEVLGSLGYPLPQTSSLLRNTSLVTLAQTLATLTIGNFESAFFVTVTLAPGK